MYCNPGVWIADSGNLKNLNPDHDPDALPLKFKTGIRIGIRGFLLEG